VTTNALVRRIIIEKKVRQHLGKISTAGKGSASRKKRDGDLRRAEKVRGGENVLL